MSQKTGIWNNRKDEDGNWVPYKAYKGKAIPLQAWTGPEVSRKLRLPDFKTFST